jgi:hypothetical protein
VRKSLPAVLEREASVMARPLAPRLCSLGLQTFRQRLSVSWEDQLATAKPNRTAGQLGEACPDCRLQIENFPD